MTDNAARRLIHRLFNDLHETLTAWIAECELDAQEAVKDLSNPDYRTDAIHDLQQLDIAYSVREKLDLGDDMLVTDIVTDPMEVIATLLMFQDALDGNIEHWGRGEPVVIDELSNPARSLMIALRTSGCLVKIPAEGSAAAAESFEAAVTTASGATAEGD